ncbi:hypothetical protein AC578_393 [Pseudocercospora eumusae]|uniref:FZ domain-containing protein n=1 Tax=Pseudocercospora eumusae TaxID=321146 RepID=A0A139HU24_9PEZI|nr:hypothetical protein AC578_393 [Pseudocercospora eumusae]
MLFQCPKLTPIQTRLLASAAALALLGLIFWSLSNPHFAYAAELPMDGSGGVRNGQDHNWHRIQEALALNAELHALDHGHGQQEKKPQKRAEADSQIQGNNIASPYTVSAGNQTLLMYPNRFLTGNHTAKGKGLPSDIQESKRVTKVKHSELRKRQDSDSDRTIYISANTCTQPVWNGSEPQIEAPPQLTLYVSTNSGNTNLGPNAGNDSQKVYPFVNGFVNASVDNASGDWYMAVSGPSLPDGFSGSWTYRLAVSIDDYFYAAEMANPFLFQVDTDSDSALLVTDNLTQADASELLYTEWMDLGAPFIMFAVNNNLTGLMGLQSSFCGLQTFVSDNHQIQAKQDDMGGNTTNVQMGMITRGLGHKPKEQFYVNALNSSSSYQAFLAMDGNSTASGDGVVGGGGKVWAPVPFSTKSDGNCQLLFNLTFCDEVAYAVPANPSNEPVSSFEALQNFYENYTTTWYSPFNQTLAQIACNTTTDAQYSLAKNCTDCAAAYKEWLCAVSIPRCEDFSNQAPYLQPRNVGQKFYNNDSMLDSDFLLSNFVPMTKAPTLEGSNAYQQTYNWSFATNRSRNQMIDEVIQPGPYKEVLPCEDLCYSLMQSCPASIQFGCPYPGRGLEVSYGKRSTSGLTCSYLGAVYYLNGATSSITNAGFLRALVVAGMVALGLALM